MSNKVTRLSKKVSHKLPFYMSLIGSIVTSVSMLSGKTYECAEEYYNELCKNKKWFKGKSVLDICNKAWSDLGNGNKSIRSHLGLFYDERNILTPMVAVCDKDGFPLPNNPSGKPYGIIGHFLDGRDYVQMEWLYDEDGNEYAEEGEDYEEIN